MGHSDREQPDVSRRDLATLIGALSGGAALAALVSCDTTGRSDGPSGLPAEPTESNRQALTGTTIAWVNTILGASPSSGTRPGDLATNTPTSGPLNGGAGLNGATVVIAEGCVYAGDGGGGVFYWSSSPGADGGGASPTGTDDGGTFIVPASGGDGGVNAAGPGWRRIYSGPLNARWFGATGDGSTNDGPGLTAAINAIPSSGGTVYFPFGIYAYATSPNYAKANTAIVADPGTVFKHTGTGNAFALDGGATGGGIYNVTVENVTVQGNANSTNGIFVRAVHHSRFNNLRVAGSSTTGSGVLTNWCVLNSWLNLRITVNEGLSPVPLNGVCLTNRGANERTTTQTFVNPIIEGISTANGVGMLIDVAHRITVVGGAWEDNVIGVRLTGNSDSNAFYDPHFESNTTYDVEVLSYNNLFSNMVANGTVQLTYSSGNTNNNYFDRGQINALTVQTNVTRTMLSGIYINSLSDSGTNTMYGQCWNSTTGEFYSDVSRAGTAAGFVTPTFGSTVAIDASLGDVFVIVPSSGSAFTIGSPTHPTKGQVITITVKNEWGSALGAATFSGYKLGAPWTQPANTFSRSIDFYYDGTNWIEKSRTAVDVSN